MLTQNASYDIDQLHDSGPFDIIGDIHGCFDELVSLLIKLGYSVEKLDKFKISHQANRRLIFVGDLVDRGPNSPDVLQLVMDAVASGMAMCVCGNHDDKLKRKLRGRDVKLRHGLKETMAQLSQESELFHSSVLVFLEHLQHHHIFDAGKLAVVHAALKEEDMGKSSPRIKAFCLYGQLTGEVNEQGLPIRYPWAQDYCGDTLIVYGHSIVPEAAWINNTVNIDTGCVFGGKLTALRYPELEIVSVKAMQTYYIEES